MGIITSIKFKIGNKEIELTEEEARQLQDSLNEIFNEKQFLPGIAPVIITRPWWRKWKYPQYPSYPYVPYESPTAPYWTVTTSNETGCCQ
jgi:hypothetical protein